MEKLISTGIVRRMDSLGRVVVPKELIDSFKIQRKQKLYINLEDDLIVLSMREEDKGGICRAIDDLNRVVIPKEIRHRLDIDERESIEFFITDNEIVLRKFLKTCAICGTSKDLSDVPGGKKMCPECIDFIKDRL